MRGIIKFLVYVWRTIRWALMKKKVMSLEPLQEDGSNLDHWKDETYKLCAFMIGGYPPMDDIYTDIEWIDLHALETPYEYALEEWRACL